MGAMVMLHICITACLCFAADCGSHHLIVFVADTQTGPTPPRGNPSQSCLHQSHRVLLTQSCLRQSHRVLLTQSLPPPITPRPAHIPPINECHCFPCIHMYISTTRSSRYVHDCNPSNYGGYSPEKQSKLYGVPAIITHHYAVSCCIVCARTDPGLPPRYNNVSMRTFNILIETSDWKRPPEHELGTNA